MANTLAHLDELIHDLSDEPVKFSGTPLTTKRALALMIASAKSPDPARMMEIAHRLMHAENGKIEVDDADIDALTVIVKDDRQFSNIIAAPVLTALDSAKNPLPPKKE